MSCRADEIAKLDKKISDLREYDKICKQRKEHLNNTTQIIDEILSKVPEQSAPPTVGCLWKAEESSTMIISFSLHNSCSNKMCQVILTKPKQLYRLFEIG